MPPTPQSGKKGDAEYEPTSSGQTTPTHAAATAEAHTVGWAAVAQPEETQTAASADELGKPGQVQAAQNVPKDDGKVGEGELDDLFPPRSPDVPKDDAEVDDAEGAEEKKPKGKGKGRGKKCRGKKAVQEATGEDASNTKGDKDKKKGQKDKKDKSNKTAKKDASGGIERFVKK